MPPPPSNSSSSSSSSSSSTKASPSPPPPPPPPQSPLFLPINETEDGEEIEENCITREEEPPPSTISTVEKPITKETPITYHHNPTPLHPISTPTTTTSGSARHSTRKRPESEKGKPNPDPDDRSVSCNKCRPTSRDKITMISSSTSSSSTNPSPNNIFRSLVSTLTRKSPRPSSASSEASSMVRDDQWKLAVAELSHKLIQATRKRDEALLEASRLKNSMNELEKKLNKLEIYCHELKSGLDVCSNNTTNTPYRNPKEQRVGNGGPHQDKIIESFVNSVSDSRSSVRLLSRSLTVQLRQMGGKVYERISTLLQPYDVKISFTTNPRSVLFYLESLLNRAFYEDFEGTGFQKSGSVPILNPIEKCEANYASYVVLHGLSWDEVLNKGTRHFSEEFSRFCDRKMSEIVAMLGWNRAWPEPLLQAFFGAAKNIWLVHLLACSLHPSLPIFRVDKDAKFEGVYMEDMGGGDKGRKLVPVSVRVMVSPGFYVYNNVVKCKVLCRYSNNHEINNLGGGV